MAKTPSLKSNAKSKSVHSRAARRAASPSVNLDKSLTSLPRPETPQVLAAHVNAGVSKKKAKSKPLTRAQRMRQEKGTERAEIVVDKLEKKVTKSLGKGKIVKARKTPWEDLSRKSNRFTEAFRIESEGQEQELDETMGDDDNLQPKAKKPFSQPAAFSVIGASSVVEEHAALDEDEEIT